MAHLSDDLVDNSSGASPHLIYIDILALNEWIAQASLIIFLYPIKQTVKFAPIKTNISYDTK